MWRRRRVSTSRTIEFTSTPDDNTVKIQYVRPQTDEVLPCVYYIHGGGMASFSCFDGMYRSWARIIANYGVAVAMVDFRNSMTPSSATEVAPFPAGLNDCLAGLRFVVAQAAELRIDAAHIVVAGESGGGNLTLATGLRVGAPRRGRISSAGCLPCARTSPGCGRRIGSRPRSRTTAS